MDGPRKTNSTRSLWFVVPGSKASDVNAIWNNHRDQEGSKGACGRFEGNNRIQSTGRRKWQNRKWVPIGVRREVTTEGEGKSDRFYTTVV